MAVVYKCRLCECEMRDSFFVTGIFSEEGRRQELAAKIFYTLWILILEEENPQFICRNCIKTVEHMYSFVLICRFKNTKIMERANNGTIPDIDYNHLLRKNPGYLTMPIFWFFNHLHGNDLYELTTRITRNENLPLNKTSMELVEFVKRNVINRINTDVNGNGTAQSFLDFANVPSTSKSDQK